MTAEVSLRMKTKSVSSKPIWPPKPPPRVPIALGALQVPSGSRATTRPLPKRPDPRKPALKTVMMARPFALDRIEGGMTLSGPKACRGLMKDERIFAHFLHSAVGREEIRNRESVFYILIRQKSARSGTTTCLQKRGSHHKSHELAQ